MGRFNQYLASIVAGLVIQDTGFFSAERHICMPRTAACVFVGRKIVGGVCLVLLFFVDLLTSFELLAKLAHI